MNADSRHIQLAAQRSAVERLDILKLMPKAEIPRIELVVGQGIKHEGIVRVGTMPHGD